jgi:hypothetical protein
MKTFEIIDKVNTGGRSLNTMFAGIPIIAIRKTSLTFNLAAFTALRLKKGSEILFSKFNGNTYLADVTNSFKIGYKLNFASAGSERNEDLLTIQSSIMVSKLELKPGYYLVKGFAEYDELNKLDWYELTPYMGAITK